MGISLFWLPPVSLVLLPPGFCSRPGLVRIDFQSILGCRVVFVGISLFGVPPVLVLSVSLILFLLLFSLPLPPGFCSLCCFFVL